MTRKEKEIQVLINNGATNIEPYTLINNYGYKFTLNNKTIDARFWENCYGCFIGWQCSNKKIEEELKKVHKEQL